VKPKGQKEVDSHDTANHLPVQDRNNEGETNSPRRSGIDAGVQSWDRVKGAYGPVSIIPWEQSGFDSSVIVDRLVLMLQGGGRRLENLRELKQEEGFNGINWTE